MLCTDCDQRIVVAGLRVVGRAGRWGFMVLPCCRALVGEWIPPVTGENRTQREVQACKTAAKVGDMKMSDDEFERAIEDALSGIPDRFKQVLENVGIAMAQEPNERELGTMCDAGGELLGLYEGIAITRRTTAYSGVMPDVITIFKGPHERVCATRAQMVEQIRKTVLHEIGHYFGFDDAYLHAHGY